MNPITHRDNAVVIDVYLQPRAARAEMAGRYGDRIKIRVPAPPVDGRANQALLDFLAEEFGVPRSRVALLAGAQARAKRVLIEAPLREPAWASTPSTP